MDHEWSREWSTLVLDFCSTVTQAANWMHQMGPTWFSLCADHANSAGQYAHRRWLLPSVPWSPRGRSGLQIWDTHRVGQSGAPPKR